MKEGLLWFDNDPERKLADKVSQAATRYQKKHGLRPTTCYVNQANLDGQTEINGIRLQAAENVRPNHFFIGVEDDQPNCEDR